MSCRWTGEKREEGRRLCSECIPVSKRVRVRVSVRWRELCPLPPVCRRGVAGDCWMVRGESAGVRVHSGHALEWERQSPNCRAKSRCRSRGDPQAVSTPVTHSAVAKSHWTATIVALPLNPRTT
ncbi:hypothetical protein AAFF_G00077940 [Aldrovandia affinis]|uniref:Uncharacterized protein n=1 Tax=Aldrovandia affinis TaxID=143900 RepID=A0AAD7S082_9TELE|nr:hypothetical protein AAFF_G00077940 [Aldrovandia affinis]